MKPVDPGGLNPNPDEGLSVTLKKSLLFKNKKPLTKMENVHYSPDEVSSAYPVSADTQRRQDHSRGVRRWVGTWNNYSNDSIDKLRSLKLTVVWGIAAKEVAPSTGTPHLQIYILFKNVVKFDTLRKLLPDVWWAPARGDNEQNYQYVTKTRSAKYSDSGELLRVADVPNDPQDVFEWGTRPNFQAMFEGMIDLMQDIAHFDMMICEQCIELANGEPVSSFCEKCQDMYESYDAAMTLLAIARSEYCDQSLPFPYEEYDYEEA